MDEVCVESWSDFMSLSAELDGWAFRGQQDGRWPLLTSLSRYLNAYIPDRASWRQREERAIRVFQRKAHNYLDDPSVLHNALRCLALMQHHGAPTRLLDFTKSPFVAVFFALERATGDAAVYALNTARLWRAAPLLKKIVLPPAVREEAMKALYRMNVTNATLFPDLDGLARSIGMELEIVWAGSQA